MCILTILIRIYIYPGNTIATRNRIVMVNLKEQHLKRSKDGLKMLEARWDRPVVALV